MDPLAQLCQKLNAERAYQTTRPCPDTAPPPYAASEADTDTDSEDSDGDCDDNPSPLKVTINAAHSIQGSHNLVPTSPTPLADATKFGALLLAAVNQLNKAACTATNETDGRRKKQRSPYLKVDLTVNCGITVIGDRNVVGNVGLKPKAPVSGALQGPVSPLDPAVLGAKRKAGDEDAEDEREQKRFAIDPAAE